MNSPIMQILALAKDMSASEARQGIQIIQARLREISKPCISTKASCACSLLEGHELEHVCTCAGSWDVDGDVVAFPAYFPGEVQGSELQAGLEEAVRRQAGWTAWGEPSDGPPEGGRETSEAMPRTEDLEYVHDQDCQACEEGRQELHSAHTDDF